MDPPTKQLSIDAEGKVKATPDTIIINAWVEINQAESQEIAYQQMNESINAIRTLVKNAGIEDSFVQTSNLSVSPSYTWDDDGNQNDNGYDAYQTLTVRIEKKDTSVVNKLLDAMSSVPHIRVSGLDYDVADKEALYAQARKIALENARTKADEIAKVAGVTIVGIESISVYTNNSSSAYPYYEKYTLDSMGSAPAPTADVAVGQLEYSASVSINYSIR